mgnify:CR=1 FL=1
MAVADFREARRRASMEQIVARLRGESVDLLSYEDVRKKLRATVSPGVCLLYTSPSPRDRTRHRMPSPA